MRFAGNIPGFMNSYAKKLMTYHIVHQLHKDGLSISRISEELVLDWRTVKKYLSMTEQSYESFLQEQSERKKGLEPYEGFIKARLSKYPDTSAAQMHDWLKEHYADFPAVNSKTVFNFVCWVRQKYHLQKASAQREYAMVAECGYGAQAQADFGEYTLRSSQGKQVKVYFLVLILARSRYKYVFFSTSRFTTEAAIQAHQQAFSFFDGIPQTVVYDQDRLFLVSENHGDLILTERFRVFSQTSSFGLHFCRRSDPESKGKIENVVKYIKQNFLYNRPFDDIDTLNQEALAWLARTANYLPHAVTRKSPAVEWETEKEYLRPYVAVTMPAAQVNWYSVRKDNSISYKGNFYSLPLGTYQRKGCRVQLVARDGQLLVFDEQGAAICHHPLSVSKGQKIINNDHKRSKGNRVQEIIAEACSQLEDPGAGAQYIEVIRKARPRYLRDQVVVFKQVIDTYPATVVTQSLHYALTHQLSSVTDLRSVAVYLHQQSQTPEITAKIIHMNPFTGNIPEQAFIQPARSSIADYQDIF
jgi:transposase